MLKIIINQSKCTGCALCVEGCFVPCLSIDEKTGKAAVINEAGCMVCRTCEDVCVRKAIKVQFSRWPGLPQDRITKVLK